MDQLRQVTVNFTNDVVESTPSITAIVDIFSNIAQNISSYSPIAKTSMEVC